MSADPADRRLAPATRAAATARQRRLLGER
jgi:hypothetical protein